MKLWKALTSQVGTAASEYMLVISVVVVGTTAAGYTFVPGFNAGVNALADDVESILSTGKVGGIGQDREMAAAGDSGNGGSTSAPTGGGSTSNCTGGLVQDCSAQTAGVGGNTGSAGTGTGASTSSVTVLQNASDHSSTAVAEAKQDVVNNATANCSQVFLASVTGQKTSTVTVNTVKDGLTVPDTMRIHIPFLGINIGNIPTDYKGFMTLDQMQQYLATQGMNASVKNSASISDIQNALENGQKVAVIMDVDDHGNPNTSCNGQCGHTVKVTSISDTTVRIKDRNGERTISRSDFENAWKPHNNGMIAVTPKSNGNVASSP